MQTPDFTASPIEALTVDFGGTATKAVHHDSRGRETLHCFDAGSYPCSETGVAALRAGLGVTPALLVATGGTSSALPSSVEGVRLHPVNEIQAIGAGGLQAAGADEALVVSIGTGTPMAVARRASAAAGDELEVTHVGGLGLGGGTIMGLGRLLCGVDSFEALDALAVQGSTEHVDLLVGDIVGSGIGVVPAELTASNFGKAARASAQFSQADIASGLFTMVGQSVARLAIMLARNAEVDAIVVVGQVIENEYMREVFERISRLFGGQFVFPPQARYTAARGAHQIATGALSDGAAGAEGAAAHAP